MGHCKSMKELLQERVRRPYKNYFDSLFQTLAGKFDPGLT